MRLITIIVLMLLVMQSRADEFFQVFRDTSDDDVPLFASSTLHVNVALVTTAPEVITGVDYRLTSVELFTLSSRSLEVFTDPVKTDEEVLHLKPSLVLDLGATTDDMNGVLIDQGTHVIARYSVALSDSANPGTYSLNTITPENAGIVLGPPSFSEHAPAGQGSYTFTVLVPEPLWLQWFWFIVFFLLALNLRYRRDR